MLLSRQSLGSQCSEMPCLSVKGFQSFLHSNHALKSRSMKNGNQGMGCVPCTVTSPTRLFE
ncbi:rCG25527 [Rattus norvegicus]|uniref:RCG25527 n=1 Tax=Rattus norvegicus TaxID=10116 RepID=A6I2K6_RAT|nr:rCG25527 [Rattus norvegicus]